jgi:ABC-2 type transport system ATP-binding protein
MDQSLSTIEWNVLSSDDGLKSSESAPPVLLAESLCKSYRRSPAIRDLSFSLNAGRVLGFLGPNGAGKTTAIRVLTTILQPDSGYFFVNGVSSDDPERVREQIGVLPESLGFPKQITGLELLTYFGELNGQMTNEARTSAMALLEEVGLNKGKAKSLVGTYSRGMRQRLGIARALINNPVVLFLDEPTLGLDPRGQEELLALIRRIARTRNTGVILCSHQLSEIENICDDVVILMSGEVIASGSVSEVISQAHQNRIRLHVPAVLAAEAEQLLCTLPRVKQVNPVHESPGWFTVEMVNLTEDSTAYMSNHILEALFRAHIPILTYEAETGLKDVFLKLTEEVAR